MHDDFPFLILAPDELSKVFRAASDRPRHRHSTNEAFGRW